MAEIMNRLIVSSILIACCMLAMAGSLRGEDTLTWKDCVMFAAENNPELISAFELISQSKASLGIVRSSYLPQISASVGINASKQKNVTDIDKIRTNNLASTGQISLSYTSTLYNTTSRSTSNSFSYGISGTQLIFDSMKTIYDIKSAESGLTSPGLNSSSRHPRSATACAARTSAIAEGAGIDKHREADRGSKVH